MFDWFLPIAETTGYALPSAPDAIDLLKRESQSLQELFERFQKSRDRRSRIKIARQALTELKINAALEEEIFYPALRRHVSKDVMNQADEEHHVAAILIQELEAMDPRDDHYDAKFNVLADTVRRRFGHEKSVMLPKAQDLDLDFGELAKQMLRRKGQLLGAKAVRKKPTQTRKRTSA